MTFYIRNVHRIWLITALDDHSRFIVNYALVKSPTADAVLEVLKGAMAKHGLPIEGLSLLPGMVLPGSKSIIQSKSPSPPNVRKD